MAEDFRAEVRFPAAQLLQGSSNRGLTRLAALRANSRLLRARFASAGYLPLVNSSVDVALSARRAWKRKLSIGYNVFLNAPPRSSGLEPDPAEVPWSGRATRWLDPWIARYCVQRILAHSRFQRELYRRIGIPPDRVTVLPHAIDVERVRRMAGFEEIPGPTNHETVKVFLLRRLVPTKGIREALVACERVSVSRPLELHVIGRGPLEDEVRRKAVHSVPPFLIRYTPSVDMATALRAMASADVVLVPSWYELFGMVVLEAMALGRCVIATARGGVAEVVRHEATGLLVPPRDEDALTEALRRVADDQRLRRTLGDAARRDVDARFAARIIAPQFLRWVDAVV